jgi:hypothetical protein
MREIGLHSGSQFDPAIVREFQRLMSARPDLHARATGTIMRARHDDDQPHLAESVA